MRVRCPTDADVPHAERTDAPGEFIIGCGHEFVAEVDQEGLVDCPNCGMWFRPREQDRVST